MYRPKAFQEDNLEKLISFMKSNSFTTFVSILNGVPFASHIPLVVKVEGDQIKLIGHLGKENPQSLGFESSESLAIFTGGHAYISPSLYNKKESVPTWNYIAVHAYGFPKIIKFNDTPDLAYKMINETIEVYENTYQSQWQGLSKKFREKMMNGMIVFEMIVTRLEGKYKLSQNRSKLEQHNISHRLLESSEDLVRSVAIEMKKNLESDE